VALFLAAATATVVVATVSLTRGETVRSDHGSVGSLCRFVPVVA
jgi:hypothetical protein